MYDLLDFHIYRHKYIKPSIERSKFVESVNYDTSLQILALVAFTLWAVLLTANVLTFNYHHKQHQPRLEYFKEATNADLQQRKSGKNAGTFCLLSYEMLNTVEVVLI